MDLDEIARRDESVRKLFAEMQASNFAHANTYVTVVVFGSYAGLFTVWTNVKDRLSDGYVYWTGIFIATSMISFVSFEIFKMIVTSREMLVMRTLISVDISPEERDELKAKASARSNFFINRVVIPIWILALAITGTTGLSAGILLMIAFIHGLTKH
jgi:hypothetical protein